MSQRKRQQKSLLETYRDLVNQLHLKIDADARAMSELTTLARTLAARVESQRLEIARLVGDKP